MNSSAHRAQRQRTNNRRPPSSPWLRGCEGQAGYTLIELLISLFVVGILLAIALPTYFTYSARAKVSEALSVSRQVVVEATLHWDVQGELPTSLADLGFTAPSGFSGSYVESVDITPTGVIEVQFRPSALGGTQILLTATNTNGSLIWTCSTPAIDPFLLPAACRP